MDSFEINKIIGALLGTVFVVFSISLVSDALFAAHPPAQPGFVIEAEEEDHGAGGAAEEKEEVSIAALLQDADPAAGEAAFRKCQACHTAEQGGANKVGPNLWDIVNRPIASHEGFSYSSAMREFATEAGDWDYEHLNGFLLNPKGYVSGTAMAFAGLKKDDERANVIAYLRTLADEPAPLPEPPAQDAETAEAAGDDTGAADAPADGESAEEAPAGGEDAADAPAETGGDEAPADNGADAEAEEPSE